MRAIGVSLYQEALDQGRAFSPRALPALGILHDFTERGWSTLDSSGNISSSLSLGPTPALAQSTSANRPPLVVEDGVSFARFVRGSSYWLDNGGGSSAVLPQSGHSGLIVWRATGDMGAGAFPAFIGGEVGGQSRGFYLFRYSSTQTTWVSRLLNGGSNSSYSANITNNTWAIATWTLTSGSGIYRTNGAAGSTITQDISSIPLHRTGARGATTASDFLQADVACICLYQVGVTVSDLQRLEGWAAWRLRKPSLLPAGHPYRNTPPLRGT